MPHPFKIPQSVLVVIYTRESEVLLIRRIRELLYEQGFTISGARNRLDSRIAEAPKQTAADSTTAVEAGAMRLELQAILDLLKV